PSPIDRDNPKAALRQVAKQGSTSDWSRAAWVLIFPEGPIAHRPRQPKGGAAPGRQAGLDERLEQGRLGA
ncbi:hypothetical protein, partial [Acinetobacter baumannii]|uniref:hypothetical protein n=1 Tax=Acinetobacter baumannii TaxID=470 RepID=UPI001D1708A5